MKQIKQIYNFLSAYPKDVVELGIEAWRIGEEDSRFKIQYREWCQMSLLLRIIMSLQKRQESREYKMLDSASSAE
ncbi:MAG: hypothetical protein QMD07_08380 [Thermodesulfovibrionales bacterium]|nr:hypothetical protein [Thermodesulfovibrionales bacterium]